YHHSYGDFDTLATDRNWYRREVRVVRLGREIRSYQDAQGFRVGPEERRVRARATGAPMFHYGWARPSQSMRQKFVASQEVFPERVDQLEAHAELEALYWTPLLRRFTGSHPRAAEAWIAARRAAAGGPAVGPRRLKVAHLRLYLSDWFERLTARAPSNTGTTSRYDGPPIRGAARRAGRGVQPPLPPERPGARGGACRAGMRSAPLRGAAPWLERLLRTLPLHPARRSPAAGARRPRAVLHGGGPR